MSTAIRKPDVGTHAPVPDSVPDVDPTTDMIHRPTDSASVTAPWIAVTVLGRFEVSVNGRAVASRQWARRHGAALVKLLAISPSRSLHRDRVIDALWPDVDYDVAVPRLHKAAHYARRALGHQDAVVLRADAVRLCPDFAVYVDAVRFRQLADYALRDGGIAEAKEALALYGGDLLPEDIYETWADPHRQELRRLYLEMLHQAEDWHQAVTADPADERAHLALARRYAELGNRVAALRQLDQLDHVMREELGLGGSLLGLDLRRHLIQASLRAIRPPAAGAQQVYESTM